MRGKCHHHYTKLPQTFVAHFLVAKGRHHSARFFLLGTCINRNGCKETSKLKKNTTLLGNYHCYHPHCWLCFPLVLLLLLTLVPYPTHVPTPPATTIPPTKKELLLESSTNTKPSKQKHQGKLWKEGSLSELRQFSANEGLFINEKRPLKRIENYQNLEKNIWNKIAMARMFSSSLKSKFFSNILFWVLIIFNSFKRSVFSYE